MLYSAHEYTAANARFAMSVEPGKSDEELLAEELAAEAERHELALAAKERAAVATRNASR